MVDTEALRAFARKSVRVRLSLAVLPHFGGKFRGLAQLARALGLGPRGRRFESSVPDICNLKLETVNAGVVQW